MEIAKQYSPKDVERRIYKTWQESKAFKAEVKEGAKPYCIMMPLPNVTGALHLGHAINNTLQDIQIRYHRMLGMNTLWQPGTDHAGIATQAVVEKRLLEEEGLTRHDLGREKLVERIWEWKDKFGGRIINQLQSMGCSCDWDRTRFTLDEVCAKAVRHTFFKMFSDGLIYRGKRMVNWDVMLQTTVSDDEVMHENVKSHLWYMAYPVKDSNQKLIIATTRPETMLGDTAVAVHPDDPRYKDLIGKKILLPLVNREIDIIGDPELVDPEFGTGCVKVTPAHDPNDYECGQRHNLEMINLLNTDGTINSNGGPFEGLDRLVARKAVVKAMDEIGLLDKIEDYETQVGHSDRSKTPIEPYLSDQWFVTMGDLAQSAMDVVENGEISFHPPRFAKMYQDWLSEKRDWPISRQLWWGHRIPIWYSSECTAEELEAAYGARDDVAWHWDKEYEQWLICSEDESFDGSEITGTSLRRDPDVLDTWFSSALWPYSTLGWPEETQDLEHWYPTSVLITNRDIVTLWVARMVMTGLYNRKEIPFNDVMVHVTILDGTGARMSKSKGNGVDPEDIISQYGADSLRFSITQMATETQDVRVPVQYKCPHCDGLTPQTAKNMMNKTLACSQCKETMASRWATDVDQKTHGLAMLTSDKFEIGRNFANKIWNASRFAMMNLEPGVSIYTPAELYQEYSDPQTVFSADEKWILEKLAKATAAVTKAIDGYHYHEYSQLMYDFLWNEFCDWYLEAAKSSLNSTDAAVKSRAQLVLACVLNSSIRLLHPMMPFLSEEIWRLLHEITGQKLNVLLIKAAWPAVQSDWCTKEQLVEIDNKYVLIGLGRSLRSEFNIAPGTKVKFIIKPETKVTEEFLAGELSTLERFMQASQIIIDKDFQPAQAMPSQIMSGATVYIELAGALDMEAESARIGKQIEAIEKYINGVERKLQNEKFVANAPASVVDGEKNKLIEARDKIEKLAQVFKYFSKK